MICPCDNDEPDPCPACGATIANGVCRATEPRPLDAGVYLYVYRKSDHEKAPL